MRRHPLSVLAAAITSIASISDVRADVGLPGFLDGANVEIGYVVDHDDKGKAARHRDRFFPAALASADASQGYDLVMYGRELGNGFGVYVGEYAMRRDDVVRTKSKSVRLGSARLHRAFAVERGERVQLIVDLRATAAIAEGTEGAPELREIDGDLRVCSSESEASVFAGVRLEDAATLGVFAALRGDPLHFESGQDCLGHPGAWGSGQGVGVALDLAPTRRVRILAAAQYERHYLTEAIGHRGDDRVGPPTLGRDQASAFLMLVVPLR